MELEVNNLNDLFHPRQLNSVSGPERQVLAAYLSLWRAPAKLKFPLKTGRTALVASPTL